MSNKNYLLNDNFPKKIYNATSTSDGLMSSEDKANLDSIFEFGLLSPATPDKNGLMSKEDKTKLDGIEEGANNYVHPNDENTRHVTDVQINKWDSQTKYTNNKPMPTALGGLEAGSTFDNIDYKDLFTRLLYPYIEPTISGINVTPSSTILENGSSITLSRIKFNINTPSLEDSVSVHYDFKLNNANIIHSLDTVNRSIDISLTVLINSNSNISVEVRDTVNNRTKAFNLINYKFIYPFYYGITTETISADIVKGGTKLIQDKGNKTIRFTTNNQKMFFAYPKEYGKLSKIYDANNFIVTNTFKVEEITISGLDNKPILYYVYSNDLSTVTDYNMQFMF